MYIVVIHSNQLVYVSACQAISVYYSDRKRIEMKESRLALLVLSVYTLLHIKVLSSHII